MRFLLIHSYLLISFPLAVHCLSLLDALRQANASQFARRIESNPEIFALYNSDSVRTIFAPADNPLSPLKLRETDDETDLQRQCMYDLNTIQDYDTLPGDVSETHDPSGNLGGRRQAVVSHGTGGRTNSTRRTLVPRQYANATVQPIKISSGLGKNASIIEGDISYDGGLIHLVDTFFAKPITLSATSRQTGNLQFADRLAESNLTGLLDNTPGITCFLPSDSAFAATGNSTQTPAQSASQLSGHVVTDEVLYLPRLVDGATYKTRAGTIITVSVRSGRYFINDAQIVQSNLILENGVAHVINKILSPAAAPVPFTGSSSSLTNPTGFKIVVMAMAFLIYHLI